MVVMVESLLQRRWVWNPGRKGLFRMTLIRSWCRESSTHTHTDTQTHRHRDTHTHTHTHTHSMMQTQVRKDTGSGLSIDGVNNVFSKAYKDVRFYHRLDNRLKECLGQVSCLAQWLQKIPDGGDDSEGANEQDIGRTISRISSCHSTSIRIPTRR